LPQSAPSISVKMSCEKTAKNPGISGIYVLADNTPAPQKKQIDIAKAALKGGARIIQFRAKNMAKPEFLTAARELAKLCKNQDALLIINDHLDIALEVGAGGVHLGADDLSIAEAKKQAPGLIIGRSTHSLEEAVEVEKQGADYIAFGAIFPTTTKGRPTPIQGVEKLKEVCAKIKKPVVAIGGINRQNLASVKKAGAAAAAFISEVVCAEKVDERVKELVSIWGSC
jgi:thiamine-phosphate pyrophosphorylase